MGLLKKYGLLLVLAFLNGSSATSVNLCCPLGKRLDNYLKCSDSEESVRDEEAIKKIIHDSSARFPGFPENVTSWTVLPSDRKPVMNTGYNPDWVQQNTSCLDIINADMLEVYKVSETREVKTNHCCPPGQAINLNNTDECVPFDGVADFKIVVLSDPFSGYERAELVSNITKQDCASEDLLYLVSLNTSCIKSETCFNAGGRMNFFVHMDDSLISVRPGSIIETFSSQQYCLAVGPDGHTVARVCRKNPCPGGMCPPTKCCKDDEYYHIDQNGNFDGCQKGGEPEVKLPVRNLEDTFSESLSVNGQRHGFPDCKFNRTFMHTIDTTDISIHSKPRTGVWLLPNASVVLATHFSRDVHDLYCSDVAWDNTTEKYRPVVVYCAEIDHSPKKNLLYRYFAVIMLTSCVFLGLTIVTYMIIPDLRNLHGMTVISNSFSLMMNFILMAIMNLEVGPYTKTLWCSVIGRTAHFFFLAAFSWLAVMTHGLYRTFSGPLNKSVSQRFSKKNLAVYSIIAWGIPGMISIFCLVMDNLDLPYYIVVPNFGVTSCWLYRNMAPIAIYLYLPVSVFLLFAVVCFALVARELYRSSKVLMGMSSKDELRQKRKRLKAIAKLFVLMGGTWIFEVMSFAIGGPQELWYITDTINLLTPVIVFAIFVCKRRVLDLLGCHYKCVGDFLSSAFGWSPLHFPASSVRPRVPCATKMTATTSCGSSVHSKSSKKEVVSKSDSKNANV